MQGKVATSDFSSHLKISINTSSLDLFSVHLITMSDNFPKYLSTIWHRLTFFPLLITYLMIFLAFYHLLATYCPTPKPLTSILVFVIAAILSRDCQNDVAWPSTPYHSTVCNNKRISLSMPLWVICNSVDLDCICLQVSDQIQVCTMCLSFFMDQQLSETWFWYDKKPEFKKANPHI